MIHDKDKSDLVFAMRKTLLEKIKTDTSFFGKQLKNVVEFVAKEATYEQLLNLVYNPDRVYNYKPTEVLEQVAIQTIMEQNPGVDKQALFENYKPKKKKSK